MTEWYYNKMNKGVAYCSVHFQKFISNSREWIMKNKNGGMKASEEVTGKGRVEMAWHGLIWLSFWKQNYKYRLIKFNWEGMEERKWRIKDDLQAVFRN